MPKHILLGIRIGYIMLFGPDARNLSMLHAHNKSTDQPAHLHSRISAFVNRYMARIVVNLAPCKLYIFWLLSVAE